MGLDAVKKTQAKVVDEDAAAKAQADANQNPFEKTSTSYDPFEARKKEEEKKKAEEEKKTSVFTFYFLQFLFFHFWH